MLWIGCFIFEGFEREVNDVYESLKVYNEDQSRLNVLLQDNFDELEEYRTAVLSLTTEKNHYKNE